MTNTTITNIAKLRAELKKIQKKGYADSLGERTPGLGSLSAPILNNNGEIVASISLAIPEIRYNDVDHRNYCLKELLSASQNCSKAIGYTIS